MSEKTTAPLAPTSASAWRGDEPEAHTLPSGNVASLRRFSVFDKLQRGEVPNALMDAAVAFAEKRPSSDYAQTVELMNWIIASCFVEPQVTVDEQAPNGALPISRLSDADRVFVLKWLNSEVSDLAPFRDDGQGSASGGDGGSLRDPAE